MLERLKQIGGIHTVEQVADILNIKRQSALNALSKLKQQGYVSVSGGGPQKRIYTVTRTKQRNYPNGMYDILNKYSDQTIIPEVEHHVHGRYTVEEALVDSIRTESYRPILASLALFNHITNWSRLYNYAKKHNVWNAVGALYDIARETRRVRRMPKRYRRTTPSKDHIIPERQSSEFKDVEQQWNIKVPFTKADVAS